MSDDKKEAQRQASRRHYYKDPKARYTKVQAYLAANPDKKAEYQRRDNERRKSRLRDPESWKRITLNNIRARSAKRGLAFNLTVDDIELPETCPVLGIPIIIGTNMPNRQASDNSPSVDRIDNSKGYIKGNVRVISVRANKLKNDASVAELEAIVRYMKAGLDV